MALHNAYLQHYKNQAGGKFPVFRGTPYQRGEGLGDIFRAVLRFLAPVASSAATTFIKNAASRMETGEEVQDAAKGALKPALFSGIARGVARAVTGKGKRRKRRTTAAAHGDGRRKKRRGTKRRATGYKKKGAKRQRRLSAPANF